MNKRFLTVSLPQLDLKAPGFYLRAKDNAFKPISVEELVAQAESTRKNLNVNENDVIFICGEVRFPFQFSLGIFFLYKNTSIFSFFSFLKKLDFFLCLPILIKIGVLNSLKYGNNLVLTGNQPLKNVSSVLKYHGKSVVVADGESVEKNEAGFNPEEVKKVKKTKIFAFFFFIFKILG